MSYLRILYGGHTIEINVVGNVHAFGACRYLCFVSN